MTTNLTWTPVWTLPNLVVLHPIETDLFALVGLDDRRLSREIKRYPALDTLLGALKNGAKMG